MAKESIDATKLRELFDYDPETGLFKWLRRDLHWFANSRSQGTWNTRYAGTPAFTHVTRKGYLEGILLRTHIFAHAAAWAWVHGEWHPEDMDHINGDRTDNRIVNLRAVSRRDNMRNKALHAQNVSGKPGVRLSKSGTWFASIGTGKTGSARTRRLGHYATLEAAISAREAAEQALKYHPNHGTRSA